MYKDFFGLNKYPFSMAPDPGCVFLTPNHREAISGITYSIMTRKGFLVLTGDAGTGKTTVLSRVLKFLAPSNVQASMIHHPTLKANEFLEMVMLDFGIVDIPDSKARRLLKLNEFVLEAYRSGKTSVLIIDEAHKLNADLLEEVRLLGNLDMGDQKLLQIVLAGQTELDQLFRREELRQLKQRIAVRVTLSRLTDGDLPEYIRYRWRAAGGKANPPFSAAAVEQVLRASKGIPRLINSICDNALLVAFANQSSVVEAAHVIEAATDLDQLAEPERPAVSASQSIPTVPAHEPVQRPLAMEEIADIRVPSLGAGTGQKSLLNRFAARLGLTA
jgi:general secretion pathway protein A